MNFEAFEAVCAILLWSIYQLLYNTFMIKKIAIQIFLMFEVLSFEIFCRHEILKYIFFQIFLQEFLILSDWLVD